MRMCSVTKFIFKCLSIVPSFLINFSHSTIDINFAEYQYIADHLSEKECHKLVAALHFHTFEMPKEIDAAGIAGFFTFFFICSFPKERRLPEDISCIDLLLHWNSTPKEGKGQTHVEVCHRLNQIGREDLAQWLSKIVFHEITKDLKVEITTEKADFGLVSVQNLTEVYSDNKILDEAAWWKIDSMLSILIVFGLVTLIVGSCFLGFLCCTGTSKEKQSGYRKLPLNEH